MKTTHFHQMIALTFISVIASLSAGCASVAVSDDALERSTLSALGMERGSLTISDRVDDGIKTTYTANTKAGKRYSCYVTGTIAVVGRVVSDAVCTEMGRSPKTSAGSNGGSCNALLRAAGKCK